MEASVVGNPQVCFMVEKVIGVCSEGNIPTYQVQWAPAWVSSLQLQGCEHLIQEFLQEQQQPTPKVETPSEIVYIHNEIAHHSVVACPKTTHKGEEQLPCVGGIEHIPPSNKETVLTQNDMVHVRTSDELAGIDLEKGNSFYTDVKEEESNSRSNEDFYGNHDSTERTTFVEVSSGYNVFASSLAFSIPADTGPNSTKKHSLVVRSDLTANDEHTRQSKQRIAPGTKVKVNRSNREAHNCSVCGQQFPFKSQLAIHFAKHSGVRRFVCTQCGKGFTKSNDLKRHMRGHTGAKPYTCNNCGKSFTRRATLRNHLTTHHPDRPHVCTQCLLSFSLKNELETHLLSHSGRHREIDTCDELSLYDG